MSKGYVISLIQLIRCISDYIKSLVNSINNNQGVYMKFLREYIRNSKIFFTLLSMTICQFVIKVGTAGIARGYRSMERWISHQ